MGWQQGDGLGKAKQGQTRPLSDGLAVQHDRLGTNTVVVTEIDTALVVVRMLPTSMLAVETGRWIVDCSAVAASCSIAQDWVGSGQSLKS